MKRYRSNAPGFMFNEFGELLVLNQQQGWVRCKPGRAYQFEVKLALQEAKKKRHEKRL